MHFPKPYPDEIVGSLVARAVRHLGLPLRVLIKEVLGLRSGHVSFFLPAGIRRLSILTGIAAPDILWRHTLFPYISAFMPQAQRDQILGALLGQQSGCGETRWIRTISSSSTRLRFCQQCVAYEVAEYGESYWHRQHLLPAVHYCLIHGSSLLVDCVPWSRARALRNLPQDLQVARVHPAPGARVAGEIARVSFRSLLPSWSLRGDRAGYYREQSERLGYLRPDGSVKSRHFVQAVAEVFGHDFLASVDCSLGDHWERAWPVLMLRPGVRTEFAPVKHVLMESFLGLAPADRRRGDGSRRGPKPRSLWALDGEVSRAVLAGWLSVKAEGKRTTVTQLLKQAGKSSLVHNHRSQLPQTAAAIRAFRQSDQSERRIRGISDLSQDPL